MPEWTPLDIVVVGIFNVAKLKSASSVTRKLAEKIMNLLVIRTQAHPRDGNRTH